jgi:TIR domain
LKIGDEFRSRIDESIQVYDRLLLILSEHSVKSRWVQKEVETAFEKEGKENRIVLFPVQIDEAVMHSTVGWAADIRRQRHIGDFRQWKDRDAYQKAFNRLLRDLKSDI